MIKYNSFLIFEASLRPDLTLTQLMRLFRLQKQQKVTHYSAVLQENTTCQSVDLFGLVCLTHWVSQTCFCFFFFLLPAVSPAL